MYVISIKHKQGHVDYKIYSKKEAKKRDLDYKYWKEADEGDWALSDDGWVAKVIKRKEYPGNRNFSNIYLRLPWGYTFLAISILLRSLKRKVGGAFTLLAVKGKLK